MVCAGGLHQLISQRLLLLKGRQVVVIQITHQPAPQLILGHRVAPKVDPADLAADQVHYTHRGRYQSIPLRRRSFFAVPHIRQEPQERQQRPILLALLGYFGEQSQKAFKDIAGTKNPALDKLRAVFEHHFRYFAENSSFSAVLFSEEIFRNDSGLSSKMFQIMQGARSHMLGFVREGQMSGQVRKDIPAEQLSLILLGALRLLVTQWRLSGFSFDLVKAGGRLWKALLGLLRA